MGTNALKNMVMRIPIVANKETINVTANAKLKIVNIFVKLKLIIQNFNLIIVVISIHVMKNVKNAFPFLNNV